MIFLDIDGPLTDLVGTFARQLGRDPSLSWWPTGEYELTKAFECTEEDLWGVTDHDWWASLPLTPYATELIDLCANWPGGFTLATSPLSHDPYSASGKLAWIQKTFGKNFRDYFIGPPKHLLAHVPEAVLIDDFHVNCDAFVAKSHCASGSVAVNRAILFPRLWNRMHHLHADPMFEVRRTLQILRKN